MDTQGGLGCGLGRSMLRGGGGDTDGPDRHLV